MTKQRANIDEIPALHRRVSTSRGFTNLRRLDDGRVAYFEYDRWARKLFVLEVVAELPVDSDVEMWKAVGTYVKVMNGENK